MAARVLYDELMHHGVEIFEYTPAFLHAKVMLVDDHWATVGSSNIDPISLLLNLEANMIVRDVTFAQDLAVEIGRALAQSEEITAHRVKSQGWAGLAPRVLIEWAAYVYLRVAGVTGRY